MKMQNWIMLALLFTLLAIVHHEALMSQDSLPEGVLNEAPEPKVEILNEIPEPPVGEAGGSGSGIPPAEALSPDYFISGGILLLTLALMAMGFFLIKADKIRSENAIRFLILALIVGGTLFLVAAGYSNSQLAPVTGLLGIVAGYLLGTWKNGRI